MWRSSGDRKIVTNKKCEEIVEIEKLLPTKMAKNNNGRKIVTNKNGEK